MEDLDDKGPAAVQDTCQGASITADPCGLAGDDGLSPSNPHTDKPPACTSNDKFNQPRAAH